MSHGDAVDRLRHAADNSEGLTAFQIAQRADHGAVAAGMDQRGEAGR